MKNIDARQLLLKYQKGICTEEELALLETWYLEYRDDKEIELTMADLDSARSSVWASLPLHEVKKAIPLWPVLGAVASVVILITAAVLFFQQEQPRALVEKKHQIVRIIPGGNKAVLTLADGSEISLTDAKDGQLASQSGITITKTKDGQLIYNIDKTNASNASTESIGFNTISTPRGGYYQVNLPDGTKVWLNAASSLRYPTSFAGAERKVELEGEGYFEVAHHVDMPFRVVSRGQVVEVLGTHFNINAYSDEADIRTTLLEGSVKVNTEVAATLLKPGEQSINYQARLRKEEVITEDIVAWKNNEFVFNNEKLGGIMRKISRWYDVDVVCPPELEDMKFNGVLPRQRSIKGVLKIMESTESVHFKFEGRRITVMP